VNIPLLSNTVADAPSGPSMKAGICESWCRELAHSPICLVKWKLTARSSAITATTRTINIP